MQGSRTGDLPSLDLSWLRVMFGEPPIPYKVQYHRWFGIAPSIRPTVKLGRGSEQSPGKVCALVSGVLVCICVLRPEHDHPDY